MVVSIHDVSPFTRVGTQAILDDLRGIGVTRVSLLVIPNHHHRGLISDDPAFAGWLREKCEEAHEAVVHGFYHLRESSGADGPWKRIVTRTYTAGEGEFYDLDEATAGKLLAAGRAAFDACGVPYCGFIAPAWLLGPEAERAVRRAGFSYTTRIATVSDFLGNQTAASRSLVWSVRAGWRLACSIVWNAALEKAGAASPLLRVGVHPPDWEHPTIRKQILQIVGRALACREAMTYEGWLSGHGRAMDRPIFPSGA